MFYQNMEVLEVIRNDVIIKVFRKFVEAYP